MLERTVAELHGEATMWLVEQALARVARDEPIDPGSIALLLRRYAETGAADLADAAGGALARALDPAARQPHRDADWLTTFAAAAVISDDDRVRRQALELAESVRRSWSGENRIDELAASVDACLSAADVLDAPDLTGDAIDQLERIVAAGYQPGAGMAHVASGGERGWLADQVRTASALLTAFHLTARLPYAMLAEELMQFARRRLWSESDDAFVDRAVDQGAGGEAEKPFVLNCEAARVLVRLAALHGVQDYRDAAVLAPDADYRSDAARVLIALASRYRKVGAAAAVYALALDELQSTAN